MEPSTALNSYSPIDISSIPVSRISSEKELETEINKICEILKDTRKFLFKDTHLSVETHDWKKRLESMKKIQEVILLFPNIANGEISINGSVYMT